MTLFMAGLTLVVVGMARIVAELILAGVNCFFLPNARSRTHAFIFHFAPNLRYSHDMPSFHGRRFRLRAMRKETQIQNPVADRFF